MDVLKGLPGITVRRHDVSLLPQIKSNNVTELNVLYPHARPRTDNGYPGIDRRPAYSSNGIYVHWNRDGVVRGTSLSAVKSDPKPILKRPSVPEIYENPRLFLEQNSSERSMASPRNERTRIRIHKKPTEAARQTQKSPSKNVTFNLENENHSRKIQEAQWSIGISRIATPYREGRITTLRALGNEKAARAKKKTNTDLWREKLARSERKQASIAQEMDTTRRKLRQLVSFSQNAKTWRKIGIGQTTKCVK